MNSIVVFIGAWLLSFIMFSVGYHFGFEDAISKMKKIKSRK